VLAHRLCRGAVCEFERHLLFSQEARIFIGVGVGN